ncbi:MAG TPA: serpin family protein, partial [Polyangiales bacterium]|nr:serpin family protein [Polyangiales bacterium]
MTRVASLAVSLITAAALCACGESTATNTGNPGTGDPSLPKGIELVRSSLERDSTPDVASAELAGFGDSSRSFALELYAQVKDGDGNLFLSPYSIATAFGMLYAGANGETKSELMSALHFDLPEPELHAAFNATDLALSSRDGLQLNVVNGAFGRKGQAFQAPYLDVLAEHYDAGMFATDFGDSEAARKAINDWVLTQTK